ncbi:MAG: 3-dehydroquinate synthase [Methylococcaceae bacterium]
MKKIIQQFTIEFQYPVIFTENVFSSDNSVLTNTILASNPSRKVKAAFIIDQAVGDCHPELLKQIEAYCLQSDTLELAIPPLLMRGGETVKNDAQYFFDTLMIINSAKMDRHAYLIAIGGGALLDMVGFAASVGHRGIRHIRIPSTVLAQNDSGVGVKNGINYFGKKNFLGTFNPPAAVINDSQLLTTLDQRDWIAGIAEAIKVALLKSPEFFSWIEKNAGLLQSRNLSVMKKLVFWCAQLHLEHIAASGDPFEQGSSRPLDFGHWSAHKLEQLSNYQIRHGEAVALGLALDLTYSFIKGYLAKQEWEIIINCLQRVGLATFHPLLLEANQHRINPELLAGLEEFREHLGGELSIMLISEIGASFEEHEMDCDVLNEAALQVSKLHLLRAS